MDAVGILFLHCNNHAVAQVADSHYRAFIRDHYVFGCGWTIRYENEINLTLTHPELSAVRFQYERQIGIFQMVASRFGVNL
jgi:hypothetical protein